MPDHAPPELIMDFLQFISECHELMGQTDLYGAAYEKLYSITVDRDQFDLASLRDWSSMAATWAVGETPINYALTMDALLANLRYNERLRSDEKETILSLGAGPGIYELYLAQMFERNEMPNLRFVCLDSAQGMSDYTNRLIEELRAKHGLRLKNIETMTADMEAFPLLDHSISQLIVNNSLGWVPNWQQAVAEMARVIMPDQLGQAYLVIHPHPMQIRDTSGELLYQPNTMTLEELLDELESHGCSIEFTRQMLANKTGQGGRDTRRIFIRGQFTNDEPGSWRSKLETGRVTPRVKFL